MKVERMTSVWTKRNAAASLMLSLLKNPAMFRQA